MIFSDFLADGMFIVLTSFALIYAFFNGYRDSSSILAGVIASRAMPPRLALALAALAEFVAPFLFGVAVARSVATGLVQPAMLSIGRLVIAMLAAILWTIFAWLRGIPSSSSHALIGGLVGVALAAAGGRAIIPQGLVRVVLPLFLAPPIGLLVGYLVMGLLVGFFSNATMRVNQLFRNLQVFTMFLLALAHSANDAQKSIGVITLGLVLIGRLDDFRVPQWVIVVCALAISLGASRGDWRLIRNLGGRIYRVRPLDALASQVASGGVVMSAALLGAPVSTSQVVSMALMGAGAAERINKVRWGMLIDMLITWGLTIPASALLAASMYFSAQGLLKIHWLSAWITALYATG